MKSRHNFWQGATPPFGIALGGLRNWSINSAIALVLAGLAGQNIAGAGDSSWFNHQVDFKTEYKVKLTPHGPVAVTAVTSITWSKWKPQGKGMTIAVDRNVSWVLDSVFNPANAHFTSRVRAHEQIHYDLAALWLREYQNKAKNLSPENDIALFDQMAKQYPLQPLDDVFEKSTGLGSNGPVQDLWTKKIAELKSRPDGSFSELEQWARRFNK